MGIQPDGLSLKLYFQGNGTPRGFVNDNLAIGLAHYDFSRRALISPMI